MTGQHRESRPIAGSPADDWNIDHTRAPAPPGSELPWESTVTAPTEWVPYAYTEAEEHRLTGRRRLSVASVVCGLGGLVLGVLGVFGIPLALAAIALAIVARSAEHKARALWASGLASGIVGLALAVGWIIYITQVVLPLV